MLFRVLIILITVFAITMFTGFVVIITSLVIEIFLSIFDLIFRLELADDLNSWAQRLYEYWLGLIQPIATDVWSRVVAWSNSSGWTALLIKLSEEVSKFGTELTRSIILLVLFISCGTVIYHQRLVRRVELCNHRDFSGYSGNVDRN